MLKYWVLRDKVNGSQPTNLQMLAFASYDSLPFHLKDSRQDMLMDYKGYKARTPRIIKLLLKHSLMVGRLHNPQKSSSQMTVIASQACVNCITGLHHQ